MGRERLRMFKVWEIITAPDDSVFQCPGKQWKGLRSLGKLVGTTLLANQIE